MRAMADCGLDLPGPSYRYLARENHKCISVTPDPAAACELSFQIQFRHLFAKTAKKHFQLTHLLFFDQLKVRERSGPAEPACIGPLGRRDLVLWESGQKNNSSTARSSTWHHHIPRSLAPKRHRIHVRSRPTSQCPSFSNFRSRFLAQGPMTLASHPLSTMIYNRISRLATTRLVKGSLPIAASPESCAKVSHQYLTLYSIPTPVKHGTISVHQ
ncbi:hypothetical protein QBC35DRAFT_124728 [Podospora australis]|uniref:Uncharacterized protein n=1 Tax=Podospora australis TaxID=1536484 RepID=A0AAN7AES1_9PEZI|nr:hypothetical protein QBC35DRAFT_124728 [Podospora australis]